LFDLSEEEFKFCGDLASEILPKDVFEKLSAKYGVYKSDS